MELLRTNCEEEFHSWFKEVKTLAEELDIPVSSPRITSRQVHRGNTPADTHEAYYRRSIMIPILEYYHRNALQVWIDSPDEDKAIPSTAVTYSSASIKDVGELYKTDLPSPQLLSAEFSRWKMKFTATAALLCCDADAFPNIHVLAFTLPVTACETERSNSLLKTYLRCTLTEERLSSLAMIVKILTWTS